MALEAKLQTRKDILERYEQIKEYRSYYDILFGDIDNSDTRNCDVFNEELMNDEDFINFLIDFARLLVRYKVGVNGTNGHWNTLTFNGKNVGMPVIDDFIMETKETMEETLKRVREGHNKNNK